MEITRIMVGDDEHVVINYSVPVFNQPPVHQVNYVLKTARNVIERSPFYKGCIDNGVICTIFVVPEYVDSANNQLNKLIEKLDKLLDDKV